EQSVSGILPMESSFKSLQGVRMIYGVFALHPTVRNCEPILLTGKNIGSTYLPIKSHISLRLQALQTHSKYNNASKDSQRGTATFLAMCSSVRMGKRLLLQARMYYCGTFPHRNY